MKNNALRFMLGKIEKRRFLSLVLALTALFFCPNAIAVEAARMGLGPNPTPASRGNAMMSPDILTDTKAVMIPERSTAKFQVWLSAAPTDSTTVTVSRVSGDPNITVLSGASLVFDASTWSNDQWVTLGAAADADKTNSTAMIRCSASNLADQDVTATNQDTDVIVNLARVSAITGTTDAVDLGALIDGVTTDLAGYGYTTWYSNPGSMTLDLKGLCDIWSMRLLLYDPDDRYYLYKIEAAANGAMSNATWTMIVDRTNPTNRCQSWQEIAFANPPIQARYLKLTGMYGPSAFFEVMEWEVYGMQPPEILTSTNAITAPEGVTTNFQVRLDRTPTSPTTVTVSRVSGGSANITVQSGASLVFNASNWHTDQTVTVAAANDDDTTNDLAVIRCGAPGLVDKDVRVTQNDTHPPLGIVISPMRSPWRKAEYGELRRQAQQESRQHHHGNRQLVSGDTNITVQSGASLMFDAIQLGHQPGGDVDGGERRGHEQWRCLYPLQRAGAGA